MLPTDAQERKNIPVYSGFICYFPDAIAEVAKLSKEGNDQHNPGTDLHWDRDKSGDERDALMRHVLDGVETITIHDAILEARAVAWRSMAQLQKLCEERDRTTDHACFTLPNGDCVAKGPCMHSIENSDSKKIATRNLNGEYWSGAGETVEEFRQRTGGDCVKSSRTAPRSLL